MNVNEISQEFDILYNQVNSNQAASIDEYEKSVFLTKAQDEIIKAYFDPRGNKFIEGFDGSEKRQYDFSLLIKSQELEEVQSYDKYDPRSIVYKWPDDVFLVLNESISEQKNGIKYIYQVIPISYTEYQRLMQKPYQYPAKRQAWRIITGNDFETSLEDQNEQGGNSGDVGRSLSVVQQATICEIIGRFYSVSIEYKMRYVKKPTPIILVNLDTEYNGLTIDGYHGNPSLSSESDIAEDNGGIPCMLPEGIHHEIVQRAVELATATYNPQALGTVTGIGNVSSTNIGIVPRQESK